ncbi:MAG: 16S rRNA (cytosine(1402)-N(4))-methyltransferase, partial [Pseudomonadota bacterium]
CVKQFIQKKAKGDSFPRKLPVMHHQMQPTLRKVGSAIKPSEEEIRRNPRARSAIMRVAERLVDGRCQIEQGGWQ